MVKFILYTQWVSKLPILDSFQVIQDECQFLGQITKVLKLKGASHPEDPCP